MARKCLIDWAAICTTEPGLASLDQVSQRLADPALDSALVALNASLYSGKDTAWDGAALAQAARRLKSQQSQRRDRGATPLQLYPQTG